MVSTGPSQGSFALPLGCPGPDDSVVRCVFDSSLKTSFLEHIFHKWSTSLPPPPSSAVLPSHRQFCCQQTCVSQWESSLCLWFFIILFLPHYSSFWMRRNLADSRNSWGKRSFLQFGFSIICYCVNSELFCLIIFRILSLLRFFDLFVCFFFIFLI